MCLGSLKSLDNKYTTFGKLIKGEEVLKALGTAKTVKGDYPMERQVKKKMISACPQVLVLSFFKFSCLLFFFVYG